MTIKILQISTLDLSGGAAQVANRLHGAYKALGCLVWMVVGHKQSSDQDIYLIPKVAKNTLWFRIFSRLKNLFAKYCSRFPGSRKIISQLELFSMGEDYFSHVRGMENFYFPGSHSVLELPPEIPELIHAHNLHG